MIYSLRNDEACIAKKWEVDEGRFSLDPADRYIVCFGAIGYPRSHGKYIRYGVHDRSDSTVEFVKIRGPLLPFGLCKNRRGGV